MADSELNPMLNPILAQNMGRWAEVYFTTPPPERERAVQELLRQLERESRDRAPHFSNSPALKKRTSDMDMADAKRSPGGDPQVICRGCGHENSTDQRFCGMCGVALAQSPALSLERIPSATIAAAPGTVGEESWLESKAGAEPETTEPVGTQHYFLEERPRDYDSDIEPPLFGSAEPSFSYSYRIFLGLALAIVLGVLGYMAWHSGQAGNNLSQDAPATAPATTDQAPAAASPAATKSEPTSNHAEAAKPENPPQNAQAKDASDAAAANTPKPPEPARAAEPAPAEKPAAAETQALTRAAKTERLQPIGNGSEELAMAQKYLDGQSGQRRDPSEAAQWLWKSVAKKNSQATLLLADLYLHGEGIQKNCDQARILLDAAARKGQAGAATRLRNIQAFGCQ